MKLPKNFIIVETKLNKLRAILKEIEAKEIYFDTFSQALESVLEYVKKNGYEIVDQEREFFLYGIGGVNYGDTKRKAFDLIKDEKPSKKKLHVQIYRMDSGRYELNKYIS